MASFNIFNPIPLIIALCFSLQFSITKALHVLGEDLIHRSDNTKDLNLVRIEYCMLIIFATTFTCALLPYFFRKNANFLLGPPFSGGVFLGTSMNFMYDSIGGKYFPSFLTLLGYFLAAFGEIILFKILKKKKTMMSWEPPAIVEVEEGRKAAAPMVVVEEESINARVAAVGVTVVIIFGLAINSFHEGIQIGQQSRRTIYAWGHLLPISMNHVLLAIALGIVALRMQPWRPFLTLVAYSFAFAISTPVGILIALSKDDDYFLVDSIFDHLLMGIFSGVFLHISINHLIGKGSKPQEAQCSYDTPPPFRNFWAVILVIGVRLFGAVISGFWL